MKYLSLFFLTLNLYATIYGDRPPVNKMSLAHPIDSQMINVGAVLSEDKKTRVYPPNIKCSRLQTPDENHCVSYTIRADQSDEGGFVEIIQYVPAGCFSKNKTLQIECTPRYFAYFYEQEENQHPVEVYPSTLLTQKSQFEPSSYPTRDDFLRSIAPILSKHKFKDSFGGDQLNAEEIENFSKRIQNFVQPFGREIVMQKKKEAQNAVSSSALDHKVKQKLFEILENFDGREDIVRLAIRELNPTQLKCHWTQNPREDRSGNLAGPVSCYFNDETERQLGLAIDVQCFRDGIRSCVKNIQANSCATDCAFKDPKIKKSMGKSLAEIENDPDLRAPFVHDDGRRPEIFKLLDAVDTDRPRNYAAPE